MNHRSLSQGVLFEMPAEQPYPALIISILPMHVDRIFQGTKLFELRKTLPATQFRRVYLYETRTGKGIVGCFDVKKIYDSVPLDELWETVGVLGTTKERFDAYFSGRGTGCAVEIANPIKFREPVIPPTLKNKKPNFSAPMSYMILASSEKLYSYLEAKRVEEMGKRDISLRLIQPQEFDSFKRVVTDEISKNYDEITERFAESILKSHEMGYDPNGIFTRNKEVYSVVAAPNQLVGFTTITYKIGGSAKTGPTILFEEFRGKSYGKAIRREIEGICRAKGVRKLYCTCADNQPRVLRYLLNGGMKVEAHLDDHYSASHGEFVLGKMLEASPAACQRPDRRDSDASGLAEATDFDQAELAGAIAGLLQVSGYDVDEARADQIASSATVDSERSYEDKPLSMVCLRSDGRCDGFVILVPKRGGSAKGVVASATGHAESVAAMISEAEDRMRRSGRRKIYVNHNISDHFIIDILFAMGYQIEGVLRQPYSAGIDHAILSKGLR
jgi:predicted transcriptional regulator/RimJ/RimL family protein N-acetyltransferase